MEGRDFMTFSHRLVRASALVGGIAVSGAFGQAPASPPSTPRINAGEMVNVEVKIVPFYASDSQGRPVTDLKPEEIEIRVGGAPVAIESFDRYVVGGKAAPRSSAPAPLPSRNVFLLFDAAFSSPGGFNTDKRLATRMLESWPEEDRLTLIVHGTRAGLEKRLGPVLADHRGKRELLAAIEALKPEIRRVGTQDDPSADFGPNGGRASRSHGPDGNNGIPEEQIHAAWDGLQGGARGEYAGVARSFAASLQTLAVQLRHLSGPKLLLIFSQGMNGDLYFDGDNGLKVGTTEATLVDTRRMAPLLNQFREPMAALADSGALPMFVNTDRGVGGAGAGGDVLGHMAKTSNGLLFEGRDPAEIESRLAGSTSAYYEAGFRPAGSMATASRAPVEVAVRRPGVRVWAPSSVRMWEPYRELSTEEKRQMAIDLVAGGPEAQSARTPVRLKFQNLGGKVVAQAASGARLLKFEPTWPADLSKRKLDVFNVMLAPPEKGRKGQVLAFEQLEDTAAGERAGIEMVLEGEGERVWGILAVDPETEQAWVRRLVLRAPGTPGRGHS
jgi:hypothetical protein